MKTKPKKPDELRHMLEYAPSQFIGQCFSLQITCIRSTQCLLKMHMPPSLQNRYLGRGSRAHIFKIPHSQHWVILMHTGVWEPHPEPKAPLLTWCPSRTAGPGVSTAWGPEGTRSPGRDLGPKRHELCVNLKESQLSEPGFLLLEMEKLEFITHNIILGYYY